MKYTATVSITGKAMGIFRFLSSRLFDLQVPILGHIFLFEQVDGKIIGKPADVIWRPRKCFPAPVFSASPAAHQDGSCTIHKA